jgi:hypothetical protein
MIAAVAVAPALPSSLLPSPSPLEVVSASSCSPESVRKRPLLPDEATDSNKKLCNRKLQLRYDPDVPMSKEETAKWRREQRRKRNRESAAASRQRQRDRISELEQQVEYYKQSLETIYAKIQALEQQKSSTHTSDPTNAPQEIVPTIQVSLPVPPPATVAPSVSPLTVKTEENVADELSIVTPEYVICVDSPEPIVSFCPSPTTSTFMDFTGSEIVPELVPAKIELGAFSSTASPQPLKMISRQAESRIIIPIIIYSFLLKSFLNNYYVGNVIRWMQKFFTACII